MLIAGEFESYSMLVVFCCCLCRILVSKNSLITRLRMRKRVISHTLSWKF